MNNLVSSSSLFLVSFFTVHAWDVGTQACLPVNLFISESTSNCIFLLSTCRHGPTDPPCCSPLVLVVLVVLVVLGLGLDSLGRTGWICSMTARQGT